MKKVILKYDEITGQVFDANNEFLFTWMNLNYEEVTRGTTSSKAIDIIAMKLAGVSEDIISDKI